MSGVDEAVAALRAGSPAILPFDTVYGLAAEAYHSAPAERLYRLKGRPATQPSALVAADLDYLLECVPELRGRSATIARALFPAPLTLIFPNPARRFRWLTGANQDAIGVRIPAVEGPTAGVLARLGCLVATSANHPGGPDPSRLDEVPEDLRAGAAAVVDGGALAGTPSTVIDFTGSEPKVVRAGAAPPEQALARATHALVA
jgi:L-threonylcarbamoyladenylate synthase